MFDHIGLKVSNLEKSVRFYEAALGGLGFVLCSHDASSAGIGPKDAPALWLYADEGVRNAGCHVAFSAADRESVDRFYRDGLAAGGRENGRPGVRRDYGPTYYAAFLTDPDGNKVEAVCVR